MDAPRGSCGVEVMTPGAVASEGMLYREADHGLAMPRARFGEAPYTSCAGFGPSMGCVGYGHHIMIRMEVAPNGREVYGVCVTISLTREGGVSGSDIG